MAKIFEDLRNMFTELIRALVDLFEFEFGQIEF